MCVYLLRGKVECTVFDEDGNALTSRVINAGEAARMLSGRDGASIDVAEFNPQGIPD